MSDGCAWEEHDLVFCYRHGGFINIETMRIWFKRLLKDAGLPMRFHNLRQSTATLLLAMGVHVKVVQELLGHSSVLITLNIYSHVLPSPHERAMNELSTLFAYGIGQDNQGDEIVGDELSQ